MGNIDICSITMLLYVRYNDEDFHRVSGIPQAERRGSVASNQGLADEVPFLLH